MRFSLLPKTIAIGLLGSAISLIFSSPISSQIELGNRSLRSYNHSERYIRHSLFRGSITPINNETDRSDATFKIVEGLADANCYSFESVNYPNHFLRHSLFALVLHPRAEDAVYKADATFCRKPGLADNAGDSFTSFNYPDRYLRHSRPGTVAFELWIDPPSGSTFNEDATFYVVDPLKQTLNQTNVSILAGDSISEQFRFQSSFLPNNRIWENKGVFGDTTQNMLRRIPSYPQNAKTVFVMIGINDLNSGQDPNIVAQNIQTIIDRLKQKYPNTPIVIQSVLPVTNGVVANPDRINENVRILNDRLEKMVAVEVSNQNNLSYLNLYDSFVGGDNKLRSNLTVDGLHLNAEGYRLWGSLLQSIE